MKKFTSFLFLALIGMLSFSASAVKFNINVDDASHVKVTYGYEPNITTLDLKDGDNDVELDVYTTVTVEAAQGYILQSVVAAGVEQSLRGSNSYAYVYVYDSHEGQTWSITTVAEDEVRTASATINVDVPENVRFQFAPSYREAKLSATSTVLRFDPK